MGMSTCSGLACGLFSARERTQKQGRPGPPARRRAGTHRRGFSLRAGCACSTLVLMWEAAGSEPAVAPCVLKTTLLVLKGKPGEMQDSFTDRRRSSLDATNMMPVAVSKGNASSPGWRFPVTESSPALRLSHASFPVLLPTGHSPNAYLPSAYAVPLRVGASERQRMSQKVCQG